MDGMMMPPMIPGAMPPPGINPAGGGMMAPGQPPFGSGNPNAMSALNQMAKTPPGKGPKEALQESQAKLQVALTRIYLINPKVAKLVSDAISKVNQAMADLEKDGHQPVGMPPNLLGGSGGQGTGLPFPG